jgi:hypothetical protein
MSGNEIGRAKFNLANKILLDKNLTPAAARVGWYIADHINTKRGYAWCPQEHIARDLGLCERSVRYAIKELAPYFAVDRSRRQHEYRIATPANIAAITPANNAAIEPTTPAKSSTTPALDVPPSFLHPLTSSEGGAATSKKVEGKKGKNGNSRKQGKRKKPVTDFPLNFKASDSYAYGGGLGLSQAEVDRACGKFKGHWVALGKQFADWDQAFRNWLDKDAEYLGRKPKGEPSTNGATVEFPMMLETPQGQAWRTYYRDTKPGMVRMLDQRQQEGRPWSFESEWPPGHQPVA